MAEKQDLVLRFRWMIEDDMPAIIAMEKQTYKFPWSKSDFMELLKSRTTIGNVMTMGELVVGYMVYEQNLDSYYIHTLTIHPEYRRRGFGKKFIDKLRNKLNPDRRHELEIHTRESNLDAHLFLKHCGFSAVEVCRAWYQDHRGKRQNTEDAYRFVYKEKFEVEV